MYTEGGALNGVAVPDGAAGPEDIGCCCYDCRKAGGCTQVASTPTKPGPSGDVPCDDVSCALRNPLGTFSVQELAGRFIKGFLGLVGVIALVMFIFGGAQMMFSQGDKTKYQKGQEALVWAVIGIIVIFGSYAIVDYIFRALLNAK